MRIARLQCQDRRNLRFRDSRDLRFAGWATPVPNGWESCLRWTPRAQGKAVVCAAIAATRIFRHHGFSARCLFVASERREWLTLNYSLRDAVTGEQCGIFGLDVKPRVFGEGAKWKWSLLELADKIAQQASRSRHHSSIRARLDEQSSTAVSLPA